MVIPSTSFKNPEELLKTLKDTMYAGSQELVTKLRSAYADDLFMREKVHAKTEAEVELRKKARLEAAVAAAAKKDDPSKGQLQQQLQQTEQVDEKKEFNQIYDDLLAAAIKELPAETVKILESTKEMGLPAWIEAYRRIKFTCNFSFDTDKNRFTVRVNTNFVERLEFTEQLAYILGLEEPTITKSTDARFVPDMKGGVSSFFIYAPGLIEPIIIGDVTAPVLRIVNIRGWPDEFIEEIYMPIQYHKLLTKEVSEIFIEIRSPSGALMPFQYGSCTLTLHFKKNDYF
jgi:hypothetical protein